jgi:8-oxo-dGTP pyrophosphatase MutT (NUDIX family)
MSPRLIRLRRPPVLSVQDGPLVPTGAGLDEIDRRWGDLRRFNPAYFDGPCWHVLGVHRNGHGGAVLHVVECSYRFFAVQNTEFDLGVRPLGVKGVVRRGGDYLVGRRSGSVASYAGMWEFAPGGCVDPPRTPADVIRSELQEETGLQLIGEPVAMAVLFDPVVRCWEIAYRLEVAAGEAAPHAPEHDELAWRALANLPEPISPITMQIASMLRTGDRG